MLKFLSLATCFASVTTALAIRVMDIVMHPFRGRRMHDETAIAAHGLHKLFSRLGAGVAAGRHEVFICPYLLFSMTLSE
jgi:hypothetical protein